MWSTLALGMEHLPRPMALPLPQLSTLGEHPPNPGSTPPVVTGRKDDLEILESGGTVAIPSAPGHQAGRTHHTHTQHLPHHLTESS